MIRLSRAEWRRQRLSERTNRPPRWFEIPEDPVDEYGDVVDDYDRFGMMMKIDTFDRAWRDLINEHGFTPVMQVRAETTDLKAAKRMLQARHKRRQQELAYGSY